MILYQKSFIEKDFAMRVSIGDLLLCRSSIAVAVVF
jgi:hypothetical protein